MPGSPIRPNTPLGSKGVVPPAPIASSGRPGFLLGSALTSSAVSRTGLTRLGKLPSNDGSIRRIRSANGGCVEKRCDWRLPNASPKNMWLISSA